MDLVSPTDWKAVLKHFVKRFCKTHAKSVKNLNIIFSAWYVEVMFTFRAIDGLKLENVFKKS